MKKLKIFMIVDFKLTMNYEGLTSYDDVRISSRICTHSSALSLNS